MTLEELNKKSDNWDFIVRDGEIKESLGYSSDICTGDTVLKLDNLIEIPNNATNGDVIMALFDIEIVDDFAFSYGIKINNSNYVQFNKDWWNAPYKKGVEE